MSNLLNKKSVLFNYNAWMADSRDPAMQVGWRSKEDQRERFKKVSKFLTDKCTLLDIGCGYGVFSDWLRKNGVDVLYKGIDINFLFISAAKERGINVELANVEEISQEYDYSVAIGTFHYLKADTENPFLLLKEYLVHILNYTRKMFIFTLVKKIHESYYEWTRLMVEDLLKGYDYEVDESNDEFMICVKKANGVECK